MQWSVIPRGTVHAPRMRPADVTLFDSDVPAGSQQYNKCTTIVTQWTYHLSNMSATRIVMAASLTSPLSAMTLLCPSSTSNALITRWCIGRPLLTSQLMDWAVDTTTGLIVTSGTCCGQEAQSVNYTFGGRSGTQSCWWMVYQICADPVWPPTPEYVIFQTLLPLTCMWNANQFCPSRVFPVQRVWCRTESSNYSVHARSWRRLDMDLFCSRLAASVLCQPSSWPSEADEAASLYDDVVSGILNDILPDRLIVRRPRPSDP